MRNTNKKGFTIVELVIVVAVIAILAAVLIPTFSGIIRKANISSDTVVAKNLNTAAISAGAKDFDSAIEAVKEAGYLLANLNAKAEGCYFVWDDVNDQFLLVDTTDDYKVIYSNIDASEKSNWFVAVKDPEAIADIEAAGCQVKKIVTSIDDLSAALTAGGEFYMDESVVLNKDNYLLFDNSKEYVVNLGDSQINSDGTLENLIPIEVKNATVTFNGGVVGGIGTGIDLDGKVFSCPIMAKDNSNVIINGTQFNTSTSSLQFAGTAVLNNVKTNSYIYSYRNGAVELNNCEVERTSSFALWVTNTIAEQNNAYIGSSTLTVNSGKYSVTSVNDTYAIASVLAGTIKINGGEFNSVDEKMFYVGHEAGKIVISGGTFNDVTFEQLCAGTETEAIQNWKNLCKGDYDVTISNGVVTITK